MIPRSNYKHCNEQDLINDAFFQDWIIYSKPEAVNFWQTFLTSHPEKREVVENAEKMLRAIGFKEHWPAEDKIQASLKETLDKINVSAKPQLSKLRLMYGARWAAAAILLMVSTGGYFLLQRSPGKEVVKSNVIQQPVQNDIAAGGSKAILTLADGTTVVLDTVNNGTLTKQGTVTVVKLDGQLAYNNSEKASTEVLYNTITTPNGGQYKLVLADGTKVWLNAASSLRYPTTFTGNERRVEVAGEAYFEVAKNATIPFKVNVIGKGEIEVLGTHFNINAYSDEPAITTTLLEGSIRFTQLATKKATLIAPGQQVLLSVEGEMKLNKQADLESAVAWKNGSFNFTSQDLVSIMRQVSRWYDVEVVYKGAISHETFTGIVGRSSNVSEVLKLMEDSGVHFKIEGKKIVVQF
jgi:transmembrane sensor